MNRPSLWILTGAFGLAVGCSGERSESSGSLRTGDGGQHDAGSPDGGAPEIPTDAGKIEISPELDAGFDANVALDSTVDAGTDAGRHTSVRIVVTRAGEPVVGAPVLFQNGAGEVLGQPVQTDSQGRAESDGAVAVVTVAATANVDGTNEGELFTYLGVKSGDDLALDMAAVATSSTPYVLPIAPQSAITVDDYHAYGGQFGCASGNVNTDTTAPLKISMYSTDPCLPDASNTLLVSAQGGSPVAPLGYALVTAEAPAGGEPATVQVGELGFGADAVVQALAIPPFASVSSALWFASGESLLPLMRRDTLHDFAVDGLDTYATPASAPDALLAHVRFPYGGEHLFQQRSSDGTAQKLTIDMSARLPDISQFQADPENPTTMLLWTADDSTSRDATIVELDYRVTAGTQATTLFHGLWRFLVPPGERRLTIPAIPNALVGLAPGDVVPAWYQMRITQVRSDLIDGYDAFRNHTIRTRPPGPLGQHLVDETPRTAGNVELLTVTWD